MSDVLNLIAASAWRGEILTVHDFCETDDITAELTYGARQPDHIVQAVAALSSWWTISCQQHSQCGSLGADIMQCMCWAVVKDIPATG